MSCTTTPSSSGSSRSRGVCTIALVAPADGGSVGVSGAPSAGGQVPPAGMETAAAPPAPALARVVEEKAAATAATAAAAALVLIAAAEVVVLLEACSQQQHQKSAVGVVEGTTIGTMSQEERREQEGHGETGVEMGEGELKLEKAEDEEEKDDDEDEDDEDEEDEEEDEDDKEDIMRSSGGRRGAMSAVRFAAWIAFAFFTGIGWAIEAGLATPSCTRGGLSQPSAVQLEVRASGTPAPVTAEGPQQSSYTAPAMINADNDGLTNETEPSTGGEPITTAKEEAGEERTHTDQEEEGEEEKEVMMPEATTEDTKERTMEDSTMEEEFRVRIEPAVVNTKDSSLVERGLEVTVSLISKAAKFARVHSLATGTMADDSNSSISSDTNNSDTNTNTNDNNSKNPVVRAFKSWTAQNKAAAEALIDGAWV